MNTKQLAESMLDGTLDYEPEDDAHVLAVDFIKLIELCERQWVVMQMHDCEFHDAAINDELKNLGAKL